MTYETWKYDSIDEKYYLEDRFETLHNAVNSIRRRGIRVIMRGLEGRLGNPDRNLVLCESGTDDKPMTRWDLEEEALATRSEYLAMVKEADILQSE